MIKTKITEMLGCKYPIIGGTMANITNPEFVAGVSNAGACAVLASANYQTPDELREAIKKTQSLTNQPFAVNINLFPALMPQDKLERWQRQMNTPYENLSEQEKESDRKEADRTIEAIR